MSADARTQVEVSPDVDLSGVGNSDSDLVMLRGLEILREWLAEPEFADKGELAVSAKAADGAREEAA